MVQVPLTSNPFLLRFRGLDTHLVLAAQDRMMVQRRQMVKMAAQGLALAVAVAAPAITAGTVAMAVLAVAVAGRLGLTKPE
jgi:hypothetical protein